ncbi:MAG: chorismate synthase [Calditrichaeota bacterium]|nr:MAG: chorismate synthase [Calditrichota bacterium]MBL1204094.1 chorismate synthase [Calditrichota bacterium]NOG43925.1 chorismate synthase [Calditrichota bacterium]
MRYLTAGESHGPGLVGIVEGLPANLDINLERVNQELSRRQQGYGRGRRQQIEKDQIEILSGIRFKKTLGSPVSFLLRNKDWKNWTEIMAIEEGVSKKEVTKPRPGHADLAGAMKYDFGDMRNVLERSSARETAIRVASGAFTRELLYAFDIMIYSHVVELGPVKAEQGVIDEIPSGKNISEMADKSPVRCLDKKAEQRMIKFIDQAKEDGDTAGGIIEVIIRNVPPGLGSYVQWDRKLDAQLAHALMSIQAVKAVEVGMGFDTARTPGSKVHDEIMYGEGKFSRKTNNAGGIEGGMSTGDDIVLRIAMKPIPTLMKPLYSVDLKTKEAYTAHVERSDVTAVPACSVIAENVVAPVLANAFMEKFGRDTIVDIEKNYNAYLERLKNI